MSVNSGKAVGVDKTSAVFTHIFQCKPWVANALLQVSEPYMPGIKNIFKKGISFRELGRGTGAYFWFISCIKHSTNRIPQELRDSFSEFVNCDASLKEIQGRLCGVTNYPLYQSTAFFRAFTSAISRPIINKEGTPTKPVPNADLYFFLIKNHERVENLKSVKKIHEWLLKESRFKPTEANFRKMCSRLGLVFKKN